MAPTPEDLCTEDPDQGSGLTLTHQDSRGFSAHIYAWRRANTGFVVTVSPGFVPRLEDRNNDRVPAPWWRVSILRRVDTAAISIQ